MSDTYHIPVLLDQSINGLNIKQNGIYADLTFGGGGHSRAILNCLGKEGQLIGFDQDFDTLANVPNDSRFIFAQSNFRYLHNFAKYYNLLPLDGILADLGVSSHHFDESERGFSFRFDGPLDMRMNQSSVLSAEYILNNYPVEKLAEIFYYYGELQLSRKIAAEIVRQREKKKIETIFEFCSIVEKYCGYDKKKELAKIFQALRIEVNDELGALKAMLSNCEKSLRRGGRLVVITYHSLEDRLVKNYVKAGNFEDKIEKDFYGNALSPFKQIGKVITPDDAELSSNPRSRRAKLRVAEKI